MLGRVGLTHAFVARGEKGEVRVRYLTNGDPDRWGFDILGLDGDITSGGVPGL